MKNEIRTFKKQIPKVQIELLKQLNTLKKQPKSDENKVLIEQKKQELISSRTRTTEGADGLTTVYFKGFDGEIYSSKGSKSGKNLRVVAVYYKYENEINWYPWILCTHLTTAQAEELFDVTNYEDLYVSHCEFYFQGFESNNNSNSLPGDFNDDEEIFTNLGINNFKGYFHGNDGPDPVWVTPEQILNGQEVVVLEDVGSGEYTVNGKIRWDINDPKITVLGWFVLIFAFLFVAGIGIRFFQVKKY